MTAAMFRLESFSGSQHATSAEATRLREAVDHAYASGFSDGMARKEDDQLRSLSAGLDRLSRALCDDEARLAVIRREAVAALAPILEAIVDSMAPASASRRLEAALRDELARLARMSAPLQAHISCGAQLRLMAERCVAESGLAGIELTDSASDRISLSLRGGRIELSPDEITQGIRALIAELKEDDATWTH